MQKRKKRSRGPVGQGGGQVGGCEKKVEGPVERGIEWVDVNQELMLL